MERLAETLVRGAFFSPKCRLSFTIIGVPVAMCMNGKNTESVNGCANVRLGKSKRRISSDILLCPRFCFTSGDVICVPNVCLLSVRHWRATFRRLKCVSMTLVNFSHFKFRTSNSGNQRLSRGELSPSTSRKYRETRKSGRRGKRKQTQAASTGFVDRK